MEISIDALKNEMKVYKRKLDSKCEALIIMSKELDKCQSERDQFKLMAEQVQERYQALRRALALGESKLNQQDEKRNKKTVQQLNSLLHESREANKVLQFEVEDLKSKLHEARGDIRLLREQLARHRVGSQEEAGIVTRHFPAHERQELIQQLEEWKDKFQQLERDLAQCLDEKEELVTERDVYKDKYERLNHELNFILKGDAKKVVDIDALVMENKYLQERLKQMEEEKSLAMATASKYKNLLEHKRSKSPLRLGQSASGSVIMSKKQVHELLASGVTLTPSPQTLHDLQSLARALLEAVSDKNLALLHQRKTNKILGLRMAELESKLKTLEVSGLWNTDASSTIERLRMECERHEGRGAVEQESSSDDDALLGTETEHRDPRHHSSTGSPTPGQVLTQSNSSRTQSNGDCPHLSSQKISKTIFPTLQGDHSTLLIGSDDEVVVNVGDLHDAIDLSAILLHRPGSGSLNMGIPLHLITVNTISAFDGTSHPVMESLTDAGTLGVKHNSQEQEVQLVVPSSYSDVQDETVDSPAVLFTEDATSS